MDFKEQEASKAWQYRACITPARAPSSGTTKVKAEIADRIIFQAIAMTLAA
jgi:hypothetical protein